MVSMRAYPGMRYWLVCGGNDIRAKAKFVRDISSEAQHEVMVKRSMVRVNMARQLRAYLSEAEESLTLDQLLTTRSHLGNPRLSASYNLDCRPIDWTKRCSRAGRTGALSFLEEAFRREVQASSDGRVDIDSAQRSIGAVSRGPDDGDLSARRLIPDTPTIKRAVSASRGSNTNNERVDFDTYIRLVEAASRRATQRSRWKLAGDEAALREAARAGRGQSTTQKLARWESQRTSQQSSPSGNPSTQVVERQGFDDGPISLWVSRLGSSGAAERRRTTHRQARQLAREVTAMALQAQRLQQRTRGSPADYTRGSGEHHTQQHTPTTRARGDAHVNNNKGSQSRPNTVRHKQQTAQTAQRSRQAQLEKPNRRTPSARTSRGAYAVVVSSQHAASPVPLPRSRDHLPVQPEGQPHERLQGPLVRREQLYMDMRREGRMGEPSRPDWASSNRERPADAGERQLSGHRRRRLACSFDEAVTLSDSGVSDTFADPG